MSGKPIWESRFRGFVDYIDSCREDNNSRLASLSVDADGKELNTADYWEEVGKHKLLKTLEQVRRNWERADWF